jgi:hypothetical protein
MTKGTCTACQRAMAKAAMIRHVASCGRSEKGPAALVMSVADRGAPGDYWLHLEVPASAPLRTLDRFLRDLWLECCGHMSMFEIDGRTYPVEDDLLGIATPGIEDGSADVPVEAVLRPGDEARHLYDMGSTTELQVRCVDRRAGHEHGEIRLLARNAPPEIACSSCGEPASVICTECSWDGAGDLCQACAGEHSCEDELYLPIVNSPRFGVCGYAG